MLDDIGVESRNCQRHCQQNRNGLSRFIAAFRFRGR